MRMTTHIWARFESKGYPLKTITLNETLSAAILHLAKWLTQDGLYMASVIEIRFARTEAELETTRKRELDSDFARELEAMLKEHPEQSDDGE